MDVALGLFLISLTLLASTLSYALRGYSRGRLAVSLSDEAQARWFERLDSHESELQLVTSFIRLTAILATMAWVNVEFLRDAQSFSWAAVATPTLVNFLILLVAAIGVPHALAAHAGEPILAKSLGVLWAARFVLYPIEKLLGFIEFLVRRLLGKSEPTRAEEAERVEQEILDAVSEGRARGAVDEEQEDFIESVFELHDTHVSEIMTPRTAIVSVPIDSTFADVRRAVLAAGHSRIPVHEDSVDHIIGVLYAKDLLRLENGDEFDIRKMTRTVPFVPETKTIDELLRQLRLEKVHIAIVLDEYGGTAGLVTIEDILEELVGEIDDEYDPETPPEINTVDADTLEVDARVHIDEVNDALEIELPDEGDYDTIGGFVFSAMGKIPDTGDEFTHENIHFKIIDAEPRKINRLRIHVERKAEGV